MRFVTILLSMGGKGDFQSATAMAVLGRAWETVWVRGAGLGSVARVGAKVGSRGAGGQEEAQERALRTTSMQGRTRGRDTLMGVG